MEKIGEKRRMRQEKEHDFFEVVLREEMEHLKMMEVRYEEESSTLPQGRLVGKRVSNKDYFYYKEKKESEALVPAEDDLLCEIMRYRQVKQESERVRRKRKALEDFVNEYERLNAMESCDKKSKGVYTKAYDYLQLKNKAWEGVNGGNSFDPGNGEIEFNPYKREELRHVTGNGTRVRSKSEAVIADHLWMNGIAFQYEACLSLGGNKFYPDFTIVRVYDGKVIYWEHFGMADNLQYANKMDQKLSFYRQYGITPWKNLITTYDDEGAINTSDIEKVIHLFLLAA